MSDSTQPKKKKKYDYGSCRMQMETKKRMDSLLKKINSPEDFGTINCDELLSYYLENTTEEDIKRIQLRSLTWEFEGKRIRKMYEKKYGKIPNSLWSQFIQTDEYREFAAKHTRIPLPWQQPLNMLQSKGKNRGLTLAIKNDSLQRGTA